MLTQNNEIWNFNATDLLSICYDCRNALKIQKMSKNSCLKEAGPSYGENIICPDNSGKNIWHKVKK